GRGVDGRRARRARAGRRGDRAVALPHPGADARHRSGSQGRVPTSLTVPRRRPPAVLRHRHDGRRGGPTVLVVPTPEEHREMLRIAVPNKGTLSAPAAEMLREAGYRQRTDERELVCRDPDNDVEFFYLRPRDIATYVGSGDLDLG